MRYFFGNILKHKYWWVFVVGLFATVTYVSGLFRYSIDLTEEKRFSLTAPTKELLDNIGSTIDIRVFLTGDLPADYKKLNIATQDMLAEFKDLSHNKINVRFEKPGDGLGDTAKAILYDSLASMGLCLSNRNSWQTITIKQRARLLFHLHWSHTKTAGHLRSTFAAAARFSKVLMWLTIFHKKIKKQH